MDARRASSDLRSRNSYATSIVSANRLASLGCCPDGLAFHHPGQRHTAYRPKNLSGEDYSDTSFPDGIEKIDPREAVAWRNRWMLQRADYVITYVTHPDDEIAEFVKKAIREGKRMIRLV